MPRQIRFIPENSLVEITCRTLQGRRFLRPTRRVREIVLGVLGRAQRLYQVEIHGFVVTGNHYHLLVTVRDAKQLADFVGYFNGNVARKVNRLIGWEGTFWADRYRAIVVSQEEAAQVARLRYICSHGVKENFVLAPADWPGASSASALGSGAMQVEGGKWFSGTKAHLARQRGDSAGMFDFGEEEVLVLTPLPCWRELDASTYRERMCELMVGIEDEARARHRRERTSPSGARAALRCNPLSRPRRIERSPPPRFHAASRGVRRMLREAHAAFVRSYREAADRLRSGDLAARFPPGSFRPALGFVPFS